MEKIYYNKLCRDKVPEIIKEKGFECETHAMEPEEYNREIVRKVYEEASGVTNHDGHAHMVAELADLVITIDALKREFSITEEELNEAVGQSLSEKGGYDKRIFLSWSSDTEYSSNEKTHGFDD